MSKKTPWLLRLPRSVLERKDALEREATQLAKVRGLAPEELASSFAFKCDELFFSRALLQRHSRFWLFRSHQQQRCGDFVLLDLSCVRVDRRVVRVLELKRNEPVRSSGGLQMQNAHELPGILARETGLVAPTASVECLTGDARALLEQLGVRFVS